MHIAYFLVLIYILIGVHMKYVIWIAECEDSNK